MTRERNGGACRCGAQHQPGRVQPSGTAKIFSTAMSICLANEGVKFVEAYISDNSYNVCVESSLSVNSQISVSLGDIPRDTDGIYEMAACRAREMASRMRDCISSSTRKSPRARLFEMLSGMDDYLVRAGVEYTIAIHPYFAAVDIEYRGIRTHRRIPLDESASAGDWTYSEGFKIASDAYDEIDRMRRYRERLTMEQTT